MNTSIKNTYTISPITQRRWQIFKLNKRAYYSLYLFLALMLVTFSANFIANDKPLLIQYKQHWYYPIFKSYPSTTFGDIFATEADYRDNFIQKEVSTHGWAIWPPIRFSYNTNNLNLLTPAPSPPSTVNWLGTDDQARDVLARLIYGLRTCILFGLILSSVSAIIGIAVGGIQGFYGGKVDLIGQRFIEIWSGLPSLFILIILASFIQPNFWWLLGIMLLFSWISYVGCVRAEFLRTRNLEYVLAAKALGVRDMRLMLKHILPNAMVATLTMLPWVVTGAIMSLTALDFLGFGLPVGSASIGELMAQAKSNLHAPWLGVSTFIAIFLLLSLLVFIGEGVRDAFDPRSNSKHGSLA